MQLSRFVVMSISVTCLVILLATTSTSAAAKAAADSSEDNRFNAGLSNPFLTLQVLEELTSFIRSQLSIETENKRQFDGGYGSRYVAAHSVGSKLMALKQAADWNGPGRKRRHTSTW